MIKAGCFAVAGVQDQTGEELAWHAYVMSASRVRLMTSVSKRRDVAGSDARSSVGRANRWCHWQDIEFFRKRGFASYDLGGIPHVTHDRHLEGLTRFKLGFGGKLVEEYSGVVPLTRRGSAVLRVRLMRPRKTLSWSLRHAG